MINNINSKKLGCENKSHLYTGGINWKEHKGYKNKLVQILQNPSSPEKSTFDRNFEKANRTFLSFWHPTLAEENAFLSKLNQQQSNYEEKSSRIR